MTAHRPIRSRRYTGPSRLERFADWIGLAMFVLCLLALGATAAALWLGALKAAWLFLGASTGSGLTMILVDLFKHRCRG